MTNYEAEGKYKMEIINQGNRIELFKNTMSKADINEDFLQWLMDEGFFTAPASTIYHGAYEGGLFDHSLAVTESLADITKKMGLEWSLPRSPYIVGMFHDLCKLDSYKKVEGFKFDTVENKQICFEHRNDSLFPDHGSKSVMMLAAWMQLTEEEILCIRYHMGAYEDGTWDYYDRAIRKYQTVLWTHTADMFASKVKDV